MTVVAGAVFACGLFVSGAQANPLAGAKAGAGAQSERNVTTVQACGWYAIWVCAKNRRSAQRAANRFAGGYVVKTSDPDYPNFRNGWYCAVDGPMSRSEARSYVRELKHEGESSAYAKNAC